jgi:hypothetical protein
MLPRDLAQTWMGQQYGKFGGEMDWELLSEDGEKYPATRDGQCAKYDASELFNFFMMYRVYV